MKNKKRPILAAFCLVAIFFVGSILVKTKVEVVVFETEPILREKEHSVSIPLEQLH